MANGGWKICLLNFFIELIKKLVIVTRTMLAIASVFLISTNETSI